MKIFGVQLNEDDRFIPNAINWECFIFYWRSVQFLLKMLVSYIRVEGYKIQI